MERREKRRRGRWWRGEEGGNYRYRREYVADTVIGIIIFLAAM